MSSSPPPGPEPARAPRYTVPAPPPAVLVRAQPRVRWTDAAGEHTVTIADRALIGSNENARIVVADPEVSHIHAELAFRDDGLWIVDLRSKNGTYVDGVRVGSARLSDAGSVRVGSTTLVIGRDVEPASVELWHEDRFGPLIGVSVAMRELFSQLARVTKSDGSVLVYGETGTGKELVARAIHECSPRTGHPFTVVDCGALSETLLDSELFGHAKGAYTGATRAHVGAIEAADGGTVFLDEVGELPLSMQPKLLRVLESRAVRRLGETTYRRVDIRLIAATHRDLRMMVNSGTFREDLYFRLAVLPVSVPPLRERLEDIPALVEHFLGKETVAAMSPQMLRELGARPWYGNVRELRNFVERAVTFGTHEALAMEPARSVTPSPSLRARGSEEPRPPSLTAGAPPAFAVPTFAGGYREFRDRWMDAGEREYLRHLLDRHRGNVAQAAQEAGLDRTYLYKLVKKHRL